MSICARAATRAAFDDSLRGIEPADIGLRGMVVRRAAAGLVNKRSASGGRVKDGLRRRGRIVITVAGSGGRWRVIAVIGSNNRRLRQGVV